MEIFMKNLGKAMAFAMIATCLLVSATSAQVLVQGNGNGSVDLPAVDSGYAYKSVANQPVIFDSGLPEDAYIVVIIIHWVYPPSPEPWPTPWLEIPGGVLGGAIASSDNSVVELRLSGGGQLQGFERTVFVEANLTCHSAPRNPWELVQAFDTDMRAVQGELTNNDDPDFSMLRVTAGTDLGLPSPGHTALYDQGDGTYLLDSSIQINYQIDFEGAPGGALGGLSGSTTGITTLSATTDVN
jgi:hypothetical protein